MVLIVAVVAVVTWSPPCSSVQEIVKIIFTDWQ